MTLYSQRVPYFTSVVITFFCFLQSYSSYSQKNLEKGNRLFDLNMFEEAMIFFQKEIEAARSKEIKIESMQQLANCYRMLGRFEEAEETYKDIFKTKKKDPKNVLNYAHALKSSAKYAEALEEYIQYTQLNPEDPMGEIYVESCRLAQQWLDEPLKREIRNFTAVNSVVPDFAPTFYGNGIVFCSSREGSKRKLISINGKNEETLLDLYFAPMATDSVPRPVEALNTYLHEGPATFSKDGKKVYFTRTVEGKRDRKKNIVLSTLQVFQSEKDSAGNWSEPQSAFSFNSSEYSVGQPSLSEDGKTIYFMSDMPGGAGGTDIYAAYKNENGAWGQPQNLGKQINTFGYELFPFIHADGTLYFSSNTHPGMGKLDVFSIKNVKGQWTGLSNLKPPVNSIADDFAFIMENDHRRGFLSSNRFNGIGYDDVYSFIEIEPLQISFDGNLLLVEDQSLFDAMKYKLTAGNGDEQPFQLVDNKYVFTLEKDTDYTLMARKEGFGYNKIKIKRAGNEKEGEERIEIKPSLKAVLVNGILREEKMLLSPDSITKMHEKNVRVAVSVVLNKSSSRIEKVNTDDGGHFVFTNGLDAGGEYSIVFTNEKWENRAVANENSVFGGATASPVKAKVHLAGLVKCGESVLDNALVLLLKDGEVIEEVIADASGKYAFEVFPDAPCTVVASKAGYIDNHINFSVSEMKEEKKSGDITLIKKEMIVIKGTATDVDGIPMINSPVTLSRGATVLAKRVTNEKGEFEFSALKDGEYSVTITQKGYMQKDILVSTVGEKVENPIVLEPKIEKISAEAKEQTLNIYYDSNSADLRAESTPALYKLIDFLKQNPTLKVEISSHTDSKGSDVYNLALSQKRAEAVVLFLYFDAELPRERMTAKGYGETKPVNHCKNGVQCSEEELGKNRRTELKVLSY